MGHLAVTRFFCVVSDAAMDAIREQLDAAWGYPNAETKTLTAIAPASECQHDRMGRPCVAIDAAYCDYILPSQLLPQLIAAGTVVEMTADQWRNEFPPSILPS